MKRFLSKLVACLKTSQPRPAARPNYRARPSLEALEARYAPSAFQVASVLAPSTGAASYCSEDVIVGAGAGAPGGHVK